MFSQSHRRAQRAGGVCRSFPASTAALARGRELKTKKVGLGPTLAKARVASRTRGVNRSARQACGRCADQTSKPDSWRTSSSPSDLVRSIRLHPPNRSMDGFGNAQSPTFGPRRIPTLARAPEVERHRPERAPLSYISRVQQESLSSYQLSLDLRENSRPCKEIHVNGPGSGATPASGPAGSRNVLPLRPLRFLHPTS